MDPQRVDLKHTLNLMRTDFPMKANLPQTEPKMLERWQQQDIYAQVRKAREGRPPYILHDGPPYANGHIHLGHAYNKILKDIVGKSYRMSGYHVPIRPGWDCHGLPIELKVTQQQPELKSTDIKKACRVYAQQWVDTQRKD